MAYLKTILTYHLPSEAEVDKSLLESHGLTVNLLNNNESRNELGAPFHIQLQVMADRADEAVGILKQFNPQRFGSAENVKKIERELAGNAGWILAAAAGSGILTYFILPAWMEENRVMPSLLAGVICGPLIWAASGLFKRK